MKKVIAEKPNLPSVLFWEFEYDTINWKKAFRTVIERTLDFGRDSEVEEVIRFYGPEKVKMVLMEYPIYLMDHSLDRACGIFGVKKEDTVCWKSKMARGNGWL